MVLLNSNNEKYSILYTTLNIRSVHMLLYVICGTQSVGDLIYMYVCVCVWWKVQMLECRNVKVWAGAQA